MAQTAPRTEHRNTFIEDAPQVSIRRAPPPQKLHPRSTRSPLSDSFPTPRANNIMLPILEDGSPSTASSDSPFDDNSMWSKRSSDASEFDEMYDMSGSESEGDVPIKLSSSVKKRMVAPRNKYPSIVIPSPSEWPTLEKLKSAVTPLSPPPKIKLAQSVLAQLASAVTPGSSSTPSLDGSLTDEEAPPDSCPSTPDISGQDDDEATTWEVPIQLDPSSISLLHQISGYDEEPEEAQTTVIEVPEEVIHEMREIVESPGLPLRMRLETQNIAPANPVDAEEELSELSIPSPGGFFASLSTSSARQNWCAPGQAPPTSIASAFYDVPWRTSDRAPPLPTSTATRFYDLPWKNSPDDIVEHVVTVEEESVGSNEPVTAMRIPSPTEAVTEVNEMDEHYDDALKATASANIDRTMLWLTAQDDYMKAVCSEEDDVVDSFKDVADAVPKTPEQNLPPTMEVSPAKKSVRFADEQVTPVEQIVPVVAEPKPKPEKKRVSPIHDGTFWEGWAHTKRSQRARDVFLHRQARAEAEHVKRTSCQTQHVEQLQGKYEIKSAERPAPSRPISDLIGAPAEDDRKFVIDRAERERQALEQMQSSSWHMSAHQEISGGKLLTSPVVQSFKSRKDVKILDLGGQVHCSWAWNVAMEHPEATVYTTVSSDAEAHVAESTLEGPANHFVLAAPKMWELPFEDNHFDIISARQLYAHLKNIWPKGEVADEWDLTLQECVRILKPGGCLEFNLLDAELIHPEPASQALGVEFAFNLKTRGYDPSSGKVFLPRLKRAGFQDIKRAWMVLPVADVIPRWQDFGKAGNDANWVTEKSIGPNGEVDVYPPPITGSTKNVRAVTGMVGARMWEQWMLKLNCETGRESRCLEGVAKALEEAGKGNAGWRCLVGWARKA